MDFLCPSNIGAAVLVAVESSPTMVEETCCRRRRFVDDNVGATTVPVFIVVVVVVEGVVGHAFDENVGPGVKATTAIVSILTANVANAKSERNKVRWTHFILVLLLILILF